MKKIRLAAMALLLALSGLSSGKIFALWDEADGACLSKARNDECHYDKHPNKIVDPAEIVRGTCQPKLGFPTDLTCT